MARKSILPTLAFAAVSGLIGLHAARAQTSTVVSDFESPGTMNNLGGYWYFYDDRTDAGESYITTADPPAQYAWDSTTFAPGAGGSGNAVNMGFVLGAKSPTCGPTCTYPAQVGIGT